MSDNVMPIGFIGLGSMGGARRHGLRPPIGIRTGRVGVAHLWELHPLSRHGGRAGADPQARQQSPVRHHLRRNLRGHGVWG